MTLSLIPYAARLRWYFDTVQTMDRWQALLAAFLEEMAAACVEAEGHVIGHIKGLALLPDGGFLRGSAVSAQYPADVAIEGSPGRPCAELEMALNVLVYGLPWDEAHQMVKATTHQVAKRWGAVVEQLAANPGPGGAVQDTAPGSHFHQQ